MTKKIERLTGGIDAIEYFNPDMNTISDYNAFGSPMPTRTWSDPNSKYKYGFNGKEKDNEINVDGGDYDFGARIYDSRLGRWLSLDPFKGFFPSFSAYSYAGNSILRFSDINGKIIWDPILKEEVKISYENGVTIYKTISGCDVSSKFLADAVPYLNILTSSETGKSVLQSYQSISTKVVIDPNDKRNLAVDGAQAAWYAIDNGKKNEDGLYEQIIVTPIDEKIKAAATKAGVSYEERLIQVFTVESSHVKTKERVLLYEKYNHDVIYEDPQIFAEVYNDLINDAITKGMEYRNEKKIEIDLKSFIPYTKLKSQDIGVNLKLNDANQKIYDELIKKQKGDKIDDK